jgi:stage V sporulation protein B
LEHSSKQTYMRSAAILAATAVLAKVISAIFKIPLFNLIGDEGSGHFQVTYLVYTLLLTISTAGIPVALSRQISAASATGRPGLVRRYFSVALPAFAAVGLFFSGMMFLFSEQIARFMSNPQAAGGLRVLSPAIFFVCIVSVFEGYSQGHQNMIPTATKQLMEVTSKLIIGLGVAWYLLQQGATSAETAAGAISGVSVGLALAVPAMVFLKRRMDRRLYPYRIAESEGADAYSRRRILYNIFRVSIPITLGASFMNIMTIIDTRFVLSRLQTGAGLVETEAVALYGVYSKGLTLLVLPSSLITPVSVSIIPALAGALAARRIREAQNIMQSSVKITNLIAMPAAVGLSVLAYPIFNVLYWGSNPVGPTLLRVFGVASYFVCMQLITTALLQANGHEKIPVISFLVGGILQILLDWYLVGNPAINIKAAPFGTLICYFVITALNMIFLLVKVKDRPKLLSAFLRPALCTAVMGVAAWAVYGLIERLLYDALGQGRMAMTVCLFLAIGVAVIVYGVLIIITRTITRSDMRLLPKGERLANLLRIRD